jgi:DNA helicase-2/ATP-dependent DNA helicase PcrA
MRAATRGLTLREIIEHMLDRSGLVDFYRTEKEGADRIENLEELVNAAESFVTQEGFGKDAVALPVDERAPAGPAATPDVDTGEIMSPLAAFLTHAALEAGDNQAQAGQDAVQLMTVHSAKGLEFDAVFIGGLEEGLFPHENALADAGGLEEERRLMYVAITRARKRLYLSFSQTRLLHGQTLYNLRSRFFDELPEDALRWLTPRQAGFRSGYAQSYHDAWQRGSGLSGIVGAGRVAPPRSVPVPAPFVAPAAGGPPSRKDAGHALRVGQTVFHPKFGEGVVTTLEGRGADARAQVTFGRHGSKWLALTVAKLTPVD